MVQKETGAPCSGLDIDVFRDNAPAGRIRTDRNGNYRLLLPEGVYSLFPHPGQKAAKFEKNSVSIRTGLERTTDLAAIAASIPESLEKSLAAYRSLRSYRNRTITEMRMIDRGKEHGGSIPFRFAFEYPNRLRLESASRSGRSEGILRISDGEKLLEFSGEHRSYTVRDAPEKLSSVELTFPWTSRISPMLGALVLLRGNTNREIFDDLGHPREIGSERLNGRRTTVVEFDKPAGSIPGLEILRLFPGMEPDTRISVRAWIDQKNHMIRKIEYDLDMDRITSDYDRAIKTEADKKHYRVIETHEDIDLNPEIPEKMFSTTPPPNTRRTERVAFRENGAESARE